MCPLIPVFLCYTRFQIFEIFLYFLNPCLECEFIKFLHEIKFIHDSSLFEHTLVPQSKFAHNVFLAFMQKLSGFKHSNEFDIISNRKNVKLKFYTSSLFIGQFYTTEKKPF